MFLSNASVRRPVAMVCLIIALIFLGVGSFSSLGLEYLPQVDVPYITITTTYPGASPSEIETDVGKKIEDAVGSLDGLKHITTTAVENACVTLIELNLDRDVDQAAIDIREKIDLILDDLPADAEKPSIVKLDTNAKPIVTLALTGDAPVSELYDYADNELSNRLAIIPGVGEVQLVGGAEMEVQVLLDRDLIAAHGLTSTDVAQAVQRGVQTVPAGWVKHHDSEYTVKYDAEYRRVEDIGNLEILNRNEARIYLKDLGKVVMATEDLRQAAFIDGRQGISIQVVKKGQANSVAVVNQVRKAVDRLKAELPGGMDLVWVSDDGDFIQASAQSTMSSIWIGVVLTAAILFLFLYNLRLTLIVGLTMPVTFAISAYFVGLMGYTMNMSTLLSVGLSVGILVTNSIVVLERIVKRFEQSGQAGEAARLGTSDVALAVLASAGTNVVVLFPIAVMGSMVGRALGPFAMTMIIATAVSLFVSFTLTPILASVMLKPRKTGGRKILGKVAAWQDRGLEGLARQYAAFLGFAGQRRWLIGLLILGVLALFYVTLTEPTKSMGFDLVANSDQGQIMVKLEYPTRYGLSQTVARVREVERILSDLPQLRHRLAVVGKVTGGGTNTEGVHLAQVILIFPEKTRRSLTLDQLLDMVRKRLADQTGTIITVSYPTAMGGQTAPIELLISGPDLEVLDGLARKVEIMAKGLDSVNDPDTTVRPGKPELRIKPKRAVLSDLGMPLLLSGHDAQGQPGRGQGRGVQAGATAATTSGSAWRRKRARNRSRDSCSRATRAGPWSCPPWPTWRRTRPRSRSSGWTARGRPSSSATTPGGSPWAPRWRT